MARRGLILDGGTGRELERIGAPFRQPEWSALALLEAPEFVRKVHDNYIGAGADVITTNSYAVVPFHIGEARFEAEGPTLAARAGRIAREAADASTDRKITVAGSLPPVFGSYQPELFDPALAGTYLGVLVNGMNEYVDVWLAETTSSLQEARAAHEAIRNTGKPLWLSFTLRDDLAAPDIATPKLRSGETVQAAAELAIALGAEAMLFNCSMPEVMEAAIAVARAAFDAAGSDIQIGVYANAFASQQSDQPANEDLSDIRTDLDPDSYGIWAQTWAKSGATIIGGCCGIGTDHIHALAGQYRCV